MSISNSRNQRRLARKSVDKRAMEHPSARRILRNIREGAGDGARETFRLDDNGSGRPLYFDVFSMNAWAAEHLKPEAIQPERERVDRLLYSGSVDPERLITHTLQRHIRPVIFCRDAAGPGEDALVDGAHRYVAFSMMTHAAGSWGLCLPAYILLPEQWRRFVIPDHVMAALFEGHRPFN